MDAGSWKSGCLEAINEDIACDIKFKRIRRKQDKEKLHLGQGFPCD